VCEIKDSEFFKCNFAVEITNGEESPRCLQAKGLLHHAYALLGYPVVAFSLACRDDACATYETCTVEDILTPLLVALAFAWVVVLDYEYALGCSDVGYCLELLEFTHDDYSVKVLMMNMICAPSANGGNTVRNIQR